MLSRYFLILLLFTNLNGYSQDNRFYALDSIRMVKMIERDSQFLTENIHPNLEYIHSNGLHETKTKHIQNIMQGIIRYDSFQFLNTQYIHRKDLLIGRGQLIVWGKYKSADFKVKLQFSNIYKRAKKRYLLLYWQSTKLQ